MSEFENNNFTDANNGDMTTGNDGNNQLNESNYDNLGTQSYYYSSGQSDESYNHINEQTYNNAYNNAQAYNYQNSTNGQTDYSNMSTREYLNNMAQQAHVNYMYGGMEQNFGAPYESNESFGDKKPKKQKKVKQKKEKNGKLGTFVKRGIAVIVAAAVFGFVSGGIFNYMTDGTLFRTSKDTAEDSQASVEADKTTEDADQDVVIPTTAVSSDGIADSQSLDVSDIAEGVMPSIVAITVQGVEEVQSFFGYIQEYEVEGAGSGIIIGENGTELLIATNNHVVSDATTVSVQFIDDEVYEAKVKGTDSDNDLAIIVVNLEDISADTLSQIKIATLGSSDDLKVGEQVVAIGNALGYGQSVTTGIISAKDRTVDTNTTPLIQTDAAINPGNSGGALLNMKGEVVGINSSKYASTDVEGMGYAIPISQVEEILDTLMNRETRDKVDEEDMGYLGISCSTISSEASEMYGIPAGVLIQEVSKGSAAEKAGLKKNYIITKFDGQSVSTSEGLVNMLEYYKAGETVEVTYKVLDDDEYVEKTTKVVLGRRETSTN